MNQLKSIFEKLTVAQQDADKPLEEVPFGVRPAWQMRKMAGAQAVVELTAQYKELLNKAITQKVFMMGAPNDVATFVKAMGELELEGLAVDASSLYKRIADAVAPSLGLRGDFSLTQVSLMNSKVGDVATENQDLDIKDAATSCVPDITSYDALVAHVKTCFKATNGNKTNIELMNKRAVKQALAQEVSEPTVLFIRGATQDELADMSLGVIGGPAVILEIPASPTTEWVTETAKKLGFDVEAKTETDSGDITQDKPKKRGRKPSTQTN